MKQCPICKARCFDDMEVCYGCLHRFESPVPEPLQQRDFISEPSPQSDLTLDASQFPSFVAGQESVRSSCATTATFAPVPSDISSPDAVFPFNVTVPFCADDNSTQEIKLAYQLTISLKPIEKSGSHARNPAADSRVKVTF